MKKILMCAAVLALATSCTDELENLSVQETASNGLTFKAEIGEPESRAELTYDEASEKWNMFWYAEDDKLAVVGKDVKSGNGTAITAWDANSKVVYKASRTLGEGFFVAENTAEAFDFYKTPQGWATPSFRYYWPADATVANDNLTGKMLVTLPSLKNQQQNDLNGSSTVKYAFMSGKLDNVALPSANPEKYSASDVLIGMKLTRKFPLALFSVKNYDKNLHGKLVEIKMTSLGHEETGEDGKEIVAEYLDYGTAQWNLTDDKLGKSLVEVTGKASTVTLKFGANGMEWEDDATAFMTFNTIDRSENTTASKMKVEYVFENITFVDEFESRTSYVAHGAYRMSGTKANPAFDLQASPYLVVKNAAARSAEETYALVINPSFTGNVSTIFTKVNGVDKVQDPFNEDITYDVTSITRLIVYPSIEGTALNKLTALADVEFKNQTSLYEDMLNASTITKLVANNVTTVDVEFNGENTPAYAELSLSKYLFNEGNEVNAIFFNDNTKASLKTLNISSVKDMVYPFKNISLVFEGYKLETVTLNAEGVNLSQRAFNNCNSLVTVNGKVNFETFDAVYAFAQTKIATIDVVGSMISENAFQKATNLAEVKFVKADLTTINKYAFDQCSSLKYFDLEKVATLGVSAFNKTALVSNNNNTNILTVGATAIPTNAFAETKVGLVRFTEATKIGNLILNNCTSLSQVRFDKAFVASCSLTNTYDGKTNKGSGVFVHAQGVKNVTLYVDKANQTGIYGYSLSLAFGESATAFEFKGIYDNSYWTE